MFNEFTVSDDEESDVSSNEGKRRSVIFPKSTGKRLRGKQTKESVSYKKRMRKANAGMDLSKYLVKQDAYNGETVYEKVLSSMKSAILCCEIKGIASYCMKVLESDKPKAEKLLRALYPFVIRICKNLRPRNYRLVRDLWNERLAPTFLEEWRIARRMEEGRYEG